MCTFCLTLNPVCRRSLGNATVTDIVDVQFERSGAFGVDCIMPLLVAATRDGRGLGPIRQGGFERASPCGVKCRMSKLISKKPSFEQEGSPCLYWKSPR